MTITITDDGLEEIHKIIEKSKSSDPDIRDLNNRILAKIFKRAIANAEITLGKDTAIWKNYLLSFLR